MAVFLCANQVAFAKSSRDLSRANGYTDTNFVLAQLTYNSSSTKTLCGALIPGKRTAFLPVTYDDWVLLEKQGVIFAPCAGYMGTTTRIENNNLKAYFYGATAASERSAYYVRFGPGNINLESDDYRYKAYGVRLVHDLDPMKLESAFKH